MTADDVATLNALPESQADEFEAFIHRQARSDARFYSSTFLECQLPGIPPSEYGASPLERRAGVIASRGYGAGGGRRCATSWDESVLDAVDS